MKMLKIASFYRKYAAFLALILIAGELVCVRPRAGATLITHGLNGSTSDWVEAMGQAISRHPRHLGTNSTLYLLTVSNQSNGITVAAEKRSSGNYVDDSSGELILLLDWSSLADGYAFNTFEIAAAVTPALMDTNLIPELGGAVVELPLHMIGHSRGGSLICEISRLLGTKGIWVDHITTLDPHPLNNDGFFDFIYPVVDAPARTYENVLFHDNYYQSLAWFVFGEPVSGAYTRQLEFLDGGYTTALTGDHSDTHLWYHGTLDFNLPATDSVAWLTNFERERWWTQAEAYGTLAGFHYSRIGNGDRMSTNRPAGANAVRDGYNQWWDFGAGNSENRTLLAQNSREWPNIIKLELKGESLMAQGETNRISAFIQAANGSEEAPFMSIFLDEDFNPWNGNEQQVHELPLSRNPTHQVGFGTADFPVTKTNSTPGVHSVLGKVTGGGHTRYIYASEFLTVFSTLKPPSLAIIPGQPPSIEVRGEPGQRVVIEESSDLANWLSLSQNWLTNTTWRYSDSREVEKSRFYRARLQ
jgi:hypothetical protein